MCNMAQSLRARRKLQIWAKKQGIFHFSFVQAVMAYPAAREGGERCSPGLCGSSSRPPAPAVPGPKKFLWALTSSPHHVPPALPQGHGCARGRFSVGLPPCPGPPARAGNTQLQHPKAGTGLPDPAQGLVGVTETPVATARGSEVTNVAPSQCGAPALTCSQSEGRSEPQSIPSCSRARFLPLGQCTCPRSPEP